MLGTDGDDVLSGGSGNDVLCGFTGYDILNGGSGNDVLVNGQGGGELYGGSGNDSLIGYGGDVFEGGSGSLVLNVLLSEFSVGADCAAAQAVSPGSTAMFYEGRLMFCDLSNANLPNANFARADLDSANLSGANLRGASFRDAHVMGADLSYADLYHADVRMANLDKVIWHETICADGSWAINAGSTCEGHLWD